MDNQIYLDNGYLNIEYILKFPVPFIFCVGGRGTGKTYGALKYCLETNTRFLYMRRTQAQADLINRPEFTPFKAVCADTGENILSVPITKYNAGFYRAVQNDDGKLIPEGDPIGYTLALSTVSNLRGFDANDCDLLIYDEFIPEKHERPLKEEGAAFANAYETINRNRELKSKPPLKVLCLANANNIMNPIFTYLKIVDKVNAMYKRGQSITINEKRGYAVVLLVDSPISRQKKETAIYKLTKGTEFYSMSTENDFNIDFTPALAINILEYTPLFTVDGIAIYKHKTYPLLYATSHISGGAKAIDSRLYRKKYRGYIIDADTKGLLQCESLLIREKLLTI